MYKSHFQSSRLAERRYKQMLEEEQKSLARNKKLLEDIDNLEEEMRCFSHECKQDEEKLNHAKTQFMQYVKSVYPKWKEDVKKWKEEKKHRGHDEKENRPFVSRQPNLHSTPRRKLYQFETSPPRLVPNSMENYGGSLEYPGNRVRNSKDTVGFGGEELEHPMDINGSYMDSSGYTRDKIGHSRDITGSYMDRSGYTKDTIGHPWDTMRHPNDRMGSSFDKMTYPRNRNPRSFREATELSWDEMGFNREYPRNDIGYPRMYNGGPWMYPQTTPPGMFSHHYFAPMPVPYGVPRWCTPGYDHLSNVYGRSYGVNDKNERQGFSGDHDDHPQNVSFEGNEQQQRKVLPNARNAELYPDQGKEPHSRNVNSFDREDFAGRPSAKYLPNDDKEPTESLNKSYENGTKQQREPSQRLSRDAHERNMEVDESYERDSKGIEEVSESRGTNFRTPNRERNRQQNGNMDGRMTMDCDGERHVQRKNKEEPTDRTTISEPFDAVKVNDRRGYIGEPVRDSRLTQLRNEGAEYGSREVMNTDSISLPTIHQYEGDPRDIFSDISDSEPLNHGNMERSNIQDGKGSSECQVPKQDNDSRGDSQRSEARDNSSGIQHGVSGQVDGKHSKEKNDSDLSNSLPRDEDQPDRKHSKDPQELAPKLAQEKKVESSAHENTRSLKREVSESKSSVVEDLIGDDVSDFEVSEAELSDEDLGGNKPVDQTLVSGNVKEGSEGLHTAVDNETEVKDERKSQGGVINENKTEDKEVRENKISDKSLPGDMEAKSSYPNISQYKETRESAPPAETKSQEPSEVLEVGTYSPGKDVFKQNDNDRRFSSDGHSNDESIAEELAKADSENTSSKRKTGAKANESKMQEDHENVEGLKEGSIQDTKHDVAENVAGKKVDSFKDEGHPNKGIKTKGPSNARNDFSLEEDRRSETKETDLNLERSSEKPAPNADKEIVEEIASEDEKSKSVVLEEVSFSSVESNSESVLENNASKVSENRTKGLSYSEDFEDEKSIPLTQSAAYQKMLSTVDVSDEGEDLEEVFLEGTMSEANTTAQSTHNMPQSVENSQIKLPAKSKPTLSLFSSGERDEFGNSFGNEGVGVLSASWKSSEGSLSPPLSPNTGGYLPSVPAANKVEDKKDQKVEEGKEDLPVDGKNGGGKGEAGKRLHESDTKSRIQAGFWNHSDSEPEVDLQISHGGNDNDDDDDDFDFYS